MPRSKVKVAENEELLGYLRELAEQYKTQRLSFTIRKAVKEIELHESEITSGRYAKDNIKGVGDFLEKKIDDFFQKEIHSSTSVEKRSTDKPSIQKTVKKSAPRAKQQSHQENQEAENLKNLINSMGLLHITDQTSNHKKIKSHNVQVEKENNSSSSFNNSPFIEYEPKIIARSVATATTSNTYAIKTKPILKNTTPITTTTTSNIQLRKPAKSTFPWAVLITLHILREKEKIEKIGKRELQERMEGEGFNELMKSSLQSKPSSYFSKNIQQMITKEFIKNSEVEETYLSSQFGNDTIELTQSGKHMASSLYHSSLSDLPSFLSQPNICNNKLYDDNNNNTQYDAHKRDKLRLVNFVSSVIDDDEKVDDGDDDDDDVINNDIIDDYCGDEEDVEISSLLTGGKVKMLIDHRELRAHEVSSKQKSTNGTSIEEILHEQNAIFDLSNLAMGDMLWVYRVPNNQNKTSTSLTKGKSKNTNFTSYSDYVILDAIVERKTVEDLCQSIVDGRFKEQKYRLQKSNFSKVFYLIEGKISGYGMMNGFGAVNFRSNFSSKTILKSACSTQVNQGFCVHYSECLNDSCTFLQKITKRLEKKYSKGIPSSKVVEFSEFQNEYTKLNNQLKLSDLFAKQLMQIKGVSGSKAKAIINIYPTPRSLLKSYRQCVSEKEKQQMLSKVITNSGRAIGPVVSRAICDFYHNR